MDISSIADSLLKFSVPERLRQRLTQRPAPAEASAELYALSRQLEADDLRVFAAACAEGVAACEGVAENPVAEAEALLRSARLHLQEEIETYRMCLPTLWDSLYYAIDAISKATDIFEQIGVTHLAVTALMELAKAMSTLARPHDAVQTYQKALDLNKAHNGTRERLVILRDLAEAHIQAGGLVEALTTYEEIVIVSGLLKLGPAKAIGWYRELARQCEIRQVLLLLIVEASPGRLSPYHAQMLAVYRSATFGSVSSTSTSATKKDDDGGAGPGSFVSFLPPMELLHLKDFVLAVTGKDLRRTIAASERLVEHLDATETAFLDYLVDLCPHPSGN
ncbi:hypothetical protein BV898_16547 [Hypsibius exemplaris]|uniref:Uncharacterized protein n=1 Tax=Hypsibius exemplaris TaxID=2072580 RepID=A0A9X6RLE0_HYPEX|nr:hypothetical protein BV898_16547 [Hypsibius exemplaris]